MADSDLLHHYKVLKQFLDISDDASSRAKSNSSRAARAREKLLKLSAAQFKELSTDVYDELKRRIDELRSEPDFLLPKLTFHPKRNQARQKLSLLPQSRFKDLVSDISYEIERRGLHAPQPTQRQPLQASSHHHTGLVTSSHRHTGLIASSHRQTGLAASSHRPTALAALPEVYRAPADIDRSPEDRTADADDRVADFTPADDLATPDMREQVPNHTVGVQATTVVPTKANLAWLSDEEEEEPRRLSLTNGFALREPEPVQERELEPPKEAPIVAEHALLQLDHAALQQDHAALRDTHTALQTGFSDLQTGYSDLELTVASLRGEVSALQAANADLEATCLALKETHVVEKESLEATVLDLKRQNDEHTARAAGLPSAAHVLDLQRDLETARAAAAALRLENQGLKNQRRELRTSRDMSAALADSKRGSVDVNSELKKFYERLDSIGSPKAPANSKEDLLRAEVSQWQRRYEAVQLEKFVSALRTPVQTPDLAKLVSPAGAVSLKSASNFFALVELLFLSLSEGADADLLFDKISAIAVSASKLSSYGDAAQLNNDHAESVREAASHALTATRYYAIHQSLVPKVVVERAVAEVAFTVCDLVATVKLRDGRVESPEVKNLKISPLSRSLDTPDDSVRPLRMANKLMAATPKRENPPIVADNDQSLPLQAASQHKATKSFPLQPKSTSLFDKLSSSVTKADIPADSSESVNQSAGAELADLNSAKARTTEPLARSPKANILDRVKQFESPPQNQNVKKTLNVISPGQSVKAKKSLFSNDPKTQESTSGIKSRDTSMTEANTSTASQGTPTRSKSIFQSLRDRFTSDNTKDGDAKSAEISTDTILPLETSTKTTSTSRDAASETVPALDEPTIDAKSASGSSTSRPVAKETAPILTESPAESIIDANGARGSTTSRNVAKETVPILTESTIGASSASGSTRNNLNGVTESATKPLASNHIDDDEDDEQLGPAMKFSSPIREPESKSESLPASNSSIYSEPEARAEPPVTSTLPEKLETSKHVATQSALLNDDLTGEVSFINSGNNTDAPVRSISLKKVEPGSPILRRVEPQAPNGGVGHQRNTSVNSIKRGGSTSLADEPRKGMKGIPMKAPSFKVKKVNYAEEAKQDPESEEEEYENEETEARQRQEYRKSMAAATFNFDLFDIDDPDNTLTQVLLYLEHQTVQVISTIQDLLSAIKKPDATRGDLRENSRAISEVIRQMTEATNTSMNQTRNHQLKEHGSWVVRSLEDCNHRMNALCKPNAEKNDLEFADRHFKQRLAGISFDIAKCTKELVKTVEEASLKEDIAHLDARINQVEAEDLT